MLEKPIAQKLFIKPDYEFYIVNAPKDYKSKIGELPKGAKVVAKPVAPIDTIQVFVANQKELAEQLPKLRPLLAPQGALWVTYLKGTSKTKTDINRDTIHAYAKAQGLLGVSLISIDNDWSAMRFKLV